MKSRMLYACLGTLLIIGCSDLPNEAARPPRVFGTDRRLTQQANTNFYPDMLALPPQSVYLQVQDGRPTIRFTTSMANIGNGPLQVRARPEGDRTISTQEILDTRGNVVETAPTGVFERHPEHNHFHVDQVSRYELRQGSLTGPIVALSAKVSFCLEDTVTFGNRSYGRFYQQCTATLQGISPGWCDVYKSDVPGQELSVANLPRGEYYLVNLYDPSNKFRDADRSNHTAWVRLELDPQQSFVRTVQESMQMASEDANRLRNHETPSWR